MNNKNNSSFLLNVLKILLLAIIVIAPMYFVLSQGGVKIEFTTPVVTTTIILCLVLVASAFSIFGYEYQFEKNAKKEKNSYKQYAPIYTTEERIKYFIRHSLWVVPLYLAVQFWFIPSLEEYSKIAHCINYGKFTGLHVVFYGLFVGLPVLMALILFLSVGIRSLKIIKLGQSPLPNEKVFTQTEYIYGSKAKLKAYGVFIYILFILGGGVLGYFSANEIISGVSNTSTKECNQSVKL